MPEWFNQLSTNPLVNTIAGGVFAKPAPAPAPAAAPAPIIVAQESSTSTYLLIGGGVLALGAVLFLAMRK